MLYPFLIIQFHQEDCNNSELLLTSIEEPILLPYNRAEAARSRNHD